MNAVDRVRAAYARIAAVDRPNLFITLRDIEDVLAEAQALDPTLPLAGSRLRGEGQHRRRRIADHG